MKHLRFKAKFLIGFVLGLCALAFAPPARAQYQPNYFVNVLTNGPVLLTNGQTLAVTTLPVTIRMGKGLAIFPYCVATDTTSANVISKWQSSYDATNYTTTFPYLKTNALNSTTAVRGIHILPPDSLDNFRTLRLTHLVNEHTNSIWVTNVIVSYSNQ